jgi:hypothetical protein
VALAATSRPRLKRAARGDAQRRLGVTRRGAAGAAVPSAAAEGE